MDSLMERLRVSWENMSEREQRMAMVLGGVLIIFILGLPLAMMASSNAELASENDHIREVLEKLANERGRLTQHMEAKRKVDAKYKNRTPPLGSFLEAQAKTQGLTLKEVTDQPEKTEGRYHRRSVRASLPGVELTPAVRLMSSIVDSRYPVSIDHLQIEHYQSGDKYNIKLGVLTYDKGGASSRSGAKK